jgi:DNA-binding NtrC family response regulator
MEKKVLMINNDEELLTSLRHVFRRSFDLVIASSADRGLQLLRAGTYALVISEDLMQTRDGTPLRDLIRESAPDTLHILITDSANRKAANEAMKKGFLFRFLTKPFTSDVLERAIEAGLDRYRQVVAPKVPMELSLEERPARGLGGFSGVCK